IVPIKAEHFATHRFGLLGVVGILVEAHRVLIEQYSNFAVGELGGKIISRLFHGGGISNGYRSFVGIELRLRLGLRRTLGGWRGRTRRRRRLTCCRRILLRRLSAGPGLGPHRDRRY